MSYKGQKSTCVPARILSGINGRLSEKMSNSELKRKFIILSLIGAFLSILICIFFSFRSGSYEYLKNHKIWMLIEIIGSAVFGIISMGGSVCYDIESWSLRRATVTHYLTVMVAFLIADFVLGWFPHSVLLVIIIAMTIIYMVIWFVMYSIGKKNITEMNADLVKFREKENQDQKEDIYE